MTDRAPATLAQSIARQMADANVERLFGVPGGGSSLQLIEAAEQAGVPFILAKTETGAAIMAAVTGELSGAPGAVLTGVGPGAASAVNGMAYAHLERSPVILFCDGPASSLHQAFDQNALYHPISKMQDRLTPQAGSALFASGLQAALSEPRGPVQFDMTAADASTVCAQTEDAHSQNGAENSSVEICEDLLSKSRRPVLIVGLETRSAEVSSAVHAWVERLGCPVLTTYRAKGVVPDAHPCMVGHFTGATLEAQCLHQADLIICVGFDPVEMIPGRWPYDAEIMELRSADGDRLPVEPATRVVGELKTVIDSLSEKSAPSDWESSQILTLKKAYKQALSLSGGPHTAESVMEALQTLSPRPARLTVDAGAHMVSAMAIWQAEHPNGVLKSNGLSTMGYALPAAIGAALHDPTCPVIAVTGDGGMLMALAELATLAEHSCDVTIIVLNDAALSLIDLKQQNLQMASKGVRYAATNFAAIAEGFGCKAWTVDPDEDVETALKQALAVKGPSLLDIAIDPSGYRDQLAALRG